MTSLDRRALVVIGCLILGIAVEIGIGDRVGATVLSITPEDGQQASVTSSIRITFTQPMVTGEVEERFSISPVTEGRITWDKNTFIFTPNRAFVPDTTYHIRLDMGATTIFGRLMTQDYDVTFTARQPSIVYASPADAETRSLYTMPFDSLISEEIFSPENGFYSFASSPDGESIAVTVYSPDGITEIWMVSSGGKTEQRIISCAPDFCGAFAWSKDGTHLAYERSVSSPSTGGITPSRIWILETKTGETYPLLEDTGITGFGPLYSPDSATLAFFDISAQGIRLVNLQDGATIIIPSQMGEVGTFSSDGTQLIYSDIRQVGGQFFPQLWKATLDETKALDVLFEDAEEDQTPRWSPDGELVAFARRKLDRAEGFALQLFILDVRSEKIRQVTSDPLYNNTSFAWSPDGRYLLVQRFQLENPSAKPELWLYDQKDDTLNKVAVNVLGGQWLP